MPDTFPYEGFFNHSSEDKADVPAIAERLREARLRLRFDESVLKRGDSIPAKIEDGPERSCVLVRRLSANACGSGQAQLEAGMVRFRDLNNKECLFSLNPGLSRCHE